MSRSTSSVIAFISLVALAAPVAASGAVSAGATLKGYEYAFTSTDGKFAGSATGGLSGSWKAEVKHTKLCLSCTPTAKINGGGFRLASLHNGWPTIVSGAFVGGTISITNPGANCSNQTFAVNGLLAGVGSGSDRTGSGSLLAKLTHYRHRVLGRCVTYGASVRGALSLNF